MNINDETLYLIEFCEGNKLKAYQDSVGIWTIGIGMTRYPISSELKNRAVLANSRVLKEDELSSESQSLELFKVLLNSQFANQLKKIIKANINDFEFGAICSLAYNIGLSAISNSTLIKKLNKGEDPLKTIETEFPKWVNAGGKKLNGLVIRRNKEIRFAKLNKDKKYTKQQIISL